MATLNRITRRSIIKGTPAAVVAGLAPAAVFAKPQIKTTSPEDEWFLVRKRELDEIARRFEEGVGDELLSDQLCDRVWALETEICERPASSLQAALIQAAILKEHAMDRHSVFAHDGPEGSACLRVIEFLEALQ